MKVEIWSDVMCPFCYIGKRRFESALAESGIQADVEWKSFQLNPDLSKDGRSVTQYLADVKGWTIDYARQVNEHVAGMAKESGLEFNFDRAVIANSFDAHRLSHFAKEQGKQDELEERLFAAYFTEGKDTSDHATLLDLAAEAGLDRTQAANVLSSSAYADEVKQDIRLAAELGIRGVPFFVFDRRLAVSGAQAVEVFKGALSRALSENNS